jgi:hypothetical protein
MDVKWHITRPLFDASKLTFFRYVQRVLTKVMSNVDEQ